MRQFIKKLQETNNGSKRLITKKELAELKEFARHKGYRIVTECNSVRVEQGDGGHIIEFPLTEHDAIKLFKTINPITFTRKTPFNERFSKK